MKAMLEYFQGAVHEIKNVTWPTEKQTYKLTRITVVFIVFFTLLFFFSDTILGSMFSAIYSFLG